MKEKIVLEVDYNWLVNRQYDFNHAVSANRIEDPKNEDATKREQNLMNVGAMQFINEIIDNHKQITKEVTE